MVTGANLRELRHRLGLSQTDLAAAIGVVQGHVGDMELGRRPVLPPTEARVRQLVAVPDLCGTCLCFVGDHLPCGCPENEP